MTVPALPINTFPSNKGFFPIPGTQVLTLKPMWNIKLSPRHNFHKAISTEVMFCFLLFFCLFVFKGRLILGQMTPFKQNKTKVIKFHCLQNWLWVINIPHNFTEAATRNSARGNWLSHLLKNKNEQGTRPIDRERYESSLIFMLLPLPLAITLLR